MVSEKRPEPRSVLFPQASVGEKLLLAASRIAFLLALLATGAFHVEKLGTTGFLATIVITLFLLALELALRLRKRWSWIGPFARLWLIALCGAGELWLQG
ncbi:MAG: hypothetical protein AAGF12_04795 [Myxococcota bacterium]